MITNLVFEGGGVLGVGFVGALQYLEENNILKNVKNFAGSSAGSFVALSLALGYSSADVKHLLFNTNFSTFKDDTYGVFRNVYRVLKRYGIYKGDKLYSWLEKLIKDKGFNKNITFEQLFKQTNRLLIVTGTCLNKRKTIYFSKDHTPNMQVALAVRISGSLPMIFKSIKINNETFVDGGVLNNYPLTVFDNENGTNWKNTLGLKLVSEHQHRTNEIANNVKEINNIYQYVRVLISSMLLQIERSAIHAHYWERTITINTFDLMSTDFDITRLDKEKLIHSGYTSAFDFFKNDAQN